MGGGVVGNLLSNLDGGLATFRYVRNFWWRFGNLSSDLAGLPVLPPETANLRMSSRALLRRVGRSNQVKNRALLRRIGRKKTMCNGQNAAVSHDATQSRNHEIRSIVE